MRLLVHMERPIKAISLNKIPVLSSSEGGLFYPHPLPTWFEGSPLCAELLDRFYVGIKSNFLFAVLHSPPPAPSFAMFSLANPLSLHWSYPVFGILILHECFSSCAPGCPPREQDTTICTNTSSCCQCDTSWLRSWGARVLCCSFS